MQKSKLILLLQTLTAWERRGFDAYVRADYFNPNESVGRLWAHLQAFAPEFDDPALEMESVWRALFPEAHYDEAKMRYLLTDLTRLAEGFLAHREWIEDSLASTRYLLKAYHKRGLNKAFAEKSRRQAQALAEVENRNHHNAVDKLQYMEQRYLAIRGSSSDRKAEDPVADVMHALDELFVLKKLRYSCELINQSNVLNKHFDFFLTEELVGYMREHPGFGGPLARLYFQALLTLQDPEGGHYPQLKQMLAAAIPHTDAGDLHDLYICALNHCIKQYNLGKQAYARELFELYRVLIENKIIFVRETLPMQHFKNAVTMGVRTGEFDWTAEFIHSHKAFLPEDEAENAFTYNMAYLEEARGNYHQVKKLLLEVDFSTVFYQLGSRTLLLRTYYELEEFEPLLYLIESFRMYIKRENSLSEYQRRLYLNLIRIVKLLARYRLGERIRLPDIQKELDQRPDTAAREWLNEKLNALHP